MNKVTLIGNLTKDPELKTTQNQVSVCQFSIAVNRRFVDASGNRGVDYFNIVAWRALGENCHKFLKKGAKAGVAGAIQTRTYDAQDGTKRHVFEIVADEVEFLTKAANTQHEPNGDPVDPADGGMTPVADDNLPF